jgi:trehalose synthase
VRSRVTPVPVASLPLDRFALVVRPDRYEAFMNVFGRARDLFRGRVAWNVNSTGRGGGVAELLRSLLAYERGAGIDARWMVVGADPAFFKVTKRIHNRLHGFPGDGGPLGEEERETYAEVSHQGAAALAEVVAPGDVVVLHDPQTAGLCGPLKEVGAIVIWRCHVGLDLPNDLAREAWDYLRPHVEPADAYVFSRRAFAWEGLDEGKVVVISPVIDAFSPKNQSLSDQQVESILVSSGAAGDGRSVDPTFMREDGSVALVSRRVEFADAGPPPPLGARVVLQVSRWDRLKDPLGVMLGFAEHVALGTDAHLVVAGPSVEAVADDPEGAGVLRDVLHRWQGLPAAVRPRIHLACIPMDDAEENGAIVNAMQSHAAVVVQKSLAEGFGLTVAEAMWKARPVVASRIGGIQDQVVHRKTGLLVKDPTNLREYGGAVTWMLGHPRKAAMMGEEARIRVRDEFLGPRYLEQHVQLVGALLEDGRPE